MRQVGTLATDVEAQRLADYLLTLGVTTRVDAAANGHSIWVYEENDVERARQAFDEFNRDPTDPRFAAAQRVASKLRQDKIDGRRKAQKNVIDLRDRWQSPARSNTPLTMTLVLISIGVTVAIDFGKRPGALQNLLQISAGGPFLNEVLAGQVWRLITPIFLHFGALHLLFDMYALYILGSVIELRRGTLVLAALVLVSAVVSNLGQYIETSPRFGGMSGVDYALFGYAWMKSGFEPTAGIYVPQNMVVMAILWLLICVVGQTSDIANTAHLVGLAVGIVSGYGPVLLKR
jgi:GlpG protein